MKPEPTEQDRERAFYLAGKWRSTELQVGAIEEALATARAEAATEAALSMRERAYDTAFNACKFLPSNYEDMIRDREVADKIRALPVEGVSDRDTLLQECRTAIEKALKIGDILTSSEFDRNPMKAAERISQLETEVRAILARLPEAKEEE